MGDTLTYHIRDMRVTFPEGRVAEKNPDRFLTVSGSAFYSVDDKGKEAANPLSITSKAIDKATAKNPVFAIDPAKGTLTLPEGRRGRAKSEGVSVDDLNAALTALRG